MNTWKPNHFLHDSCIVGANWVIYFWGLIGAIVTSSSHMTSRAIMRCPHAFYFPSKIEFSLQKMPYIVEFFNLYNG
jgi:hypothetical protein